LKRTIALTVNGARRTVEAEADTPLLYVLRNDLGLKSPKYGCGVEQCGSCTVQIDGQARLSCGVLCADVEGKKIVTVEGIGSRAKPHPLQTAFVAEQALQCGYCTAGILMAAKALLERNGNPNDDEIRTALRDNLCRCGSHPRVIKAVRRAAREMTR
jgi:nicotinate dehydrogenase subunit A